MEQLLVDFFSKSSELILSNRLVNYSPSLMKTIQHNFQFQLSFNQKFQFNSKIPSQWRYHNNKLLVLEFFLSNKKTNDKYLAEQWIFELNEVSNSKLPLTIDSQNSLYKRLAVLLRTISLLTVSLTLWKNILRDRTGLLAENFNIDYSINFTRHSLSTWHPLVHEDNSLTSYSNPDLVLPGRAFAFKVNYLKSHNFILKLLENNLNQLKFTQEFTKDWQSHVHDRSHSSLPRERCSSTNSDHRSTSETYKQINSLILDNSPGFFHTEDKEPIFNLLEASPIETQRSTRHIKSMTCGHLRRVSSGQLSSDTPKRQRFYTIESEPSGELDMYVYDDPENKITEVLTEQEVHSRSESPQRFSLHPKTNEDEEDEFVEISGKPNKHEMKLSLLSKKIETILEKNDDDKIAEIFHAIDTIRDLVKPADNRMRSNSVGKRLSISSLTHIEKNDSPVVQAQKTPGLNFLGTIKSKENLEEDNLISDFQIMRGLYLELKHGSV